MLIGGHLRQICFGDGQNQFWINADDW